MTVSAWLLATRQYLQEELQLGPSGCDVRPDGSPPPIADDVFIAIHGGSKNPGPSNDQDLGMDILVGIQITVTMRTAFYNDTDTYEPYVVGANSLEPLVERISLLMHKKYALMGKANVLLGDTTYPYIEPLRWLGGDAEPRKVDNSWFNPQSEDEQGGYVGMVMQANFGGARRCLGVSG